MIRNQFEKKYLYIFTMLGFYTYLMVLLGALRCLAVYMHYTGNNPYGSPVVISAGRLIPNAMLIELALILGIGLFFGLIDRIIKTDFARFKLRVLGGLTFFAHIVLCIFDYEIIRWMGQHITLSYITNYAGGSDEHMGAKLFELDSFNIIAALAFMVSNFLIIFLFVVLQKRFKQMSLLALLVTVALFVVTVSSPAWFRSSDKRWRRIRPAAISITYDIYAELSGLQRPQNPEQASRDMVSFFRKGDIGLIAKGEKIAEYPFYGSDNVGSIPIKDFKRLPREKKPNIVVFVFETWRGWKSGLQERPDSDSKTPILDSIVKNEGWYFPWTHSFGFPSVEGSVNLHLGIMNHYNKIIKSNYLSMNSKGLPEIMREAGYNTHVVVGVDPSFSNFTPWLNRWYEPQNIHFNPDFEDDKLLIENAIELFDAERKKGPTYMTLWTAVTHPPYYVPGCKNKSVELSEARYDIAIKYAADQAVHFINSLKKMDWENTIVIITGDHGQPNPEQLQYAEQIGELNPGHTWVNMAWLGGFPGLPRGRVDHNVGVIDVAPTLLKLIDLKANNHFMGSDLGDYPVGKKQMHVRQKQLVLQTETNRTIMNIGSEATFQIPTSKDSVVSFGLLTGADRQMEQVDSKKAKSARYKDMMKAWTDVLDGNKLMPLNRSSSRQE